jgi:hypothetical protein
MASIKVIVTNASALVAKYGKSGYTKISTALKQLIAADAKRGLSDKLIEIDSKTAMAPYGSPVATVGDARAAKAAIDAIYAKERPDYIMILGAGDVVPLVQLKNPVYSQSGDLDKTVPSDLPYACDAAYGTDINAFVGPTRVVGRLPDMAGAKSPDYVIKLITLASEYKTMSVDDYRKYFGLSAQVWQQSTALSLSNLFGSSSVMKTTPPSGPSWTAAQLAPRLHFINCHGAHVSSDYYGQPASGQQSYPVAHSARLLPKKIVPGTVMTAECCYGAELFDPSLNGGQAGIAYTYLGEGAYGVFGSTTIAYGPSKGNGSADLICQYFLHSVMGSASTGRAALEARHRFVNKYSHLDPVDMKTLGQFYLLGDPSIQAVATVPHALSETKAFQAAFAKSGQETRALRRERLERTGKSLKQYMPKTVSAAKGSAPAKEVSKVLADVAQESGMGSTSSIHFTVKHRMRGKQAETERSIHVVMAKHSGEKSEHDSPVRHVVAIIATAEDGRLMHLRRLHSR